MPHRYKIRVSILFSILCWTYNLGLGQWEPLGGPYGSITHRMIQSDDAIFAQTTNGLFLFDTLSSCWRRMNIKQSKGSYPLYVAKQENSILAIVNTDIDFNILQTTFRSNDNGESWVELSTNFVGEINNLISIGNSFYISSSEGIFLSMDDGESWTNSSLNSSLDETTFLHYQSNKLICAQDSLLYISNGDDIWDSISVLFPIQKSKLFVFDSIFFVFGKYDGRLHASSDYGKTWQPSFPHDWNYSNFIKVGKTIYTFKDEFLYRSINNGIQFLKLSQKTFPYIHHILPYGDSILVGTSEGLYVTDTLLRRKSLFHCGVDASWIITMTQDDDAFWMGVKYSGVVRMPKDSIFAQKICNTQDPTLSILRTHDKIYTTDGSKNLSVSSNNGIIWTHPPGISYSVNSLKELFEDDKYVYVSGEGSSGKVMYQADKRYDTWYPFTIDEVNLTEPPKAIYQIDDFKYAIYDRKIARWEEGSGWTVIATENHIYTTIEKFIPGKQLIGYIDYRGLSPYYTLHVSEDFGDTWKTINTDSLFPGNFSLGFFKAHFIGDIIIADAGGIPGGVYISHDAGDTWRPFQEGLHSHYIKDFLHDEQYIYASSFGQGIYRRKIDDLVSTQSKREITASSSLHLFPNPSNGVLNVTIPKQAGNEGTVFVTDITGNIIFQSPYRNKDLIEISLPKLNSGIYLVTLKSTSHVYSSKFTIMGY